MAKKGSAKQEKFFSIYDGTNIREAAKIAELSYGYARLLVTKPSSQERLQERSKQECAPLIATRQERQEFWTETMRDKREEMKSRQKASELLGKSEADFTEKVQAETTLTVVRKSYGRGK